MPDDETFFGAPAAMCVRCLRGFFDEEEITVAKSAGKELLYHGECFEAWAAQERDVGAIFDLTTVDAVETSTRVYRKPSSKPSL